VIQVVISINGNEYIVKFIIFNTGKHKEHPLKGSYICRYNNETYHIPEHVRDDGVIALVHMCLEAYLNEKPGYSKEN
jgi:hypothetical protein